MDEAFAKKYAEEITLAYYCINSLLTLLVFVVGTIYFRRRDQKDQREQEWRKFAERINSDYNSLRSNHILERVSHVKKTFGRVQICSKVTGLTILSYWLSDAHYQDVSRVSPQLRALREDLHKIFVPLNFCSSFISIREVPENTKEELRYVIEELVNASKPFFARRERKVALKCLNYFDIGEPDEDPERIKLGRLPEVVPYVQSLKFGDDDQREPHQDNSSTTISQFPKTDYSQCIKFSFYISMLNSDCNFLKDLHGMIEKGEYKSTMVRIIKDEEAESPLQLIECIHIQDSDELVLAKVLHEVRWQIHNIQECGSRIETDRTGRIREFEIIARLRRVHEIAMVSPLSKKNEIKHLVQSFIGDLELFAHDPPDHLCNDEFTHYLHKMRNQFQKVCTIPARPRPVESNNRLALTDGQSLTPLRETHL